MVSVAFLLSTRQTETSTLTPFDCTPGSMTPNFTIKSGANSYMVYLDIIFSASEYFRSASQFGIEASEGVITLHDDAPAMVDMLVEFLQNANYHPTT